MQIKDNDKNHYFNTPSLWRGSHMRAPFFASGWAVVPLAAVLWGAFYPKIILAKSKSSFVP